MSSDSAMAGFVALLLKCLLSLWCLVRLFVSEINECVKALDVREDLFAFPLLDRD